MGLGTLAQTPPACSRPRRKGQRDSAPGNNLFLQTVSLRCGSPREEPQIKVVVIICNEVLAWNVGPFQCPFHHHVRYGTICIDRQSTAKSHFPSWAYVINSVTTPLSCHCCTESLLNRAYKWPHFHSTLFLQTSSQPLIPNFIDHCQACQLCLIRVWLFGFQVSLHLP